MNLKAGWYFVVNDCVFYENTIVPCRPYVMIAHYSYGEWDSDLLYDHEEYIVQPIKFPSVEEMNNPPLDKGKELLEAKEKIKTLMQQANVFKEFLEEFEISSLYDDYREEQARR